MEELELILQTVSNLGGEARWLFIFYIIKELAIYIIGFSCLGGGLIGTYKIISRIIPAINFENEIKKVAGTGNWISFRERSNIIDILRKHYSI